MFHRTSSSFVSFTIGSLFALAASHSSARAQGVCFETAPPLNVGYSPRGLALGDLDGDGDRDLVLSYQTTFEVLFNQGDGTFASPVQYFPPATFELGALVDLDGDGDRDLLGRTYTPVAILVRRNQGNGAFALGTSYPTGYPASALATGDIDGDGDVDVVTSNSQYLTQSVLRNQGDGSFGPWVMYDTGPGTPGGSTGSFDVALGDVDADGDLDLVGTICALDVGDHSYITIRRNDGSGTFGNVELTDVDTAKPTRLALEDFNADGALDIAINDGGVGVRIYFNPGDGTFRGGASHYPIGPSFDIASYDLDGDGDKDLAARNYYNVPLLVNNGSGVFDALPGNSVDIAAGQRSAIGDLNGDLRPEILTFTIPTIGPGLQDLIVLRNCLTTPTSYCFGDGSEAVCPCDNPGYVGRGCANLAYGSGARLSATGTPSVSNDSLVLTSASMSGAQSWYFQATGHDAVPFGRGILCVSGALIRVGQKSVIGGSSMNPAGGTDLPLSVKGAIPPSGGTRFYQVSYRHANPTCTPTPVSNTNRTNGVAVVWTP